MNATEFANWQRFHGARFGMWASWLGNLPKEASEARPSQADTLAAMFEVLADVTYQDACDASRRLACGDEPEIDQLDQHTRTVRAVAKRLGAERTKRLIAAEPKNLREPRYHCFKCSDTGRLEVWTPETMRAAKTNGAALIAGDIPSRTCVVACKCGTGRAFSEKAGYVPLSSRMVTVPDSLRRAERLSVLVEVVTAPDRNAWNPDDPGMLFSDDEQEAVT